MSWLSKLPVPILAGENEDVDQIYIRERNNVVSVGDLTDLVTRWAYLWEEIPLIDEQITIEFKRLRASNKRYTFDPSDKVQRVVADLLIPPRLLMVYVIARKYGVPFNVALIQIHGDDEDKEQFF